MKKDSVRKLFVASRVLLGAIMFVSGLLKIFGPGIAGVEGMLSGMGFPLAGFFAVILIFSEIIFGAAVIVGWKLKYTVLPLGIVLFVAAFTAHLGDWSRMIMHFALIVNYFIVAYQEV